MRKLGLVIALLGASALAPALSHAQSPDAFAKALHIYGSYRVVPDITYLTANNWEAKLDVYQARDATTPNPTLVYFHGGGWVAGSKEASSLTFLPFLSMGWNVVNVEYRLAKISLAPAAVQDALCTLHSAVGSPERQRVQYGHEPARGHGELGWRTPCAYHRNESHERKP
jgi:acetyl esterase/lipase